MEVTLKKASALSLALLSHQVPIRHTVAIDVFSDAPSSSDIDGWNSQLVESLAASQAIIEAGYTIRSIVGKANEGVINDLLTRRAGLNKLLSVLSAVPVRDDGPNLQNIQRALDAAREIKLGGSRGVNVGLSTAPHIVKPIRDIKKQLVKIDDELAKLNFSTTVKLPDGVVEVLNSLDLV